MFTLDSILMARTSSLLEEQLAELTDVKNWSKDTRDATLEQIELVADRVCEQGYSFIRDIVENTTPSGVPLLKQILYLNVMRTQSEMFYNFISFLASLTTEEMKEQPLDIEWVFSLLQKNLQVCQEIEEDINAALLAILAKSEGVVQAL